MLRVVDFNREHIKEAMALAMDNYQEERQHLPVLPKLEAVPDLSFFAKINLGVAATQDDRLVGFLCAWPPVEDVFETTGVRGTFVPIHAHGAITEDRGKIYSRMLQAAMVKWVGSGILSLGISLYTHDDEAIKSFFHNGFGMRCIDAIRPMEPMPMKEVTGLSSEEKIEYLELPKEEWGRLLDLHNTLINHMGSSPIHMKYALIDEEELYRRTSEDTRYYAARIKDSYLAYIKLGDNGESFISGHESMVNICGACCQQQYRGRNIYHNLLSHMISVLKAEGYTLLGVDMESFNPNARGFWLKYFSEYTNSVVRRIDDKAVIK